MNPLPLNLRTSLAVAASAVLALTGCSPTTNETADYNATEQAEAEARGKDPAWKPAYRESTVIKVGQQGEELNNFCCDTNGNLLACVSGAKDGSSAKTTKPAVRVYDPDGKLLQTWSLDAEPQAVCVEADGNVLVAGGGVITRLDRTGKVLASAKTPASDAPLPPDDELKEVAKRFGSGTPAEQLAAYKNYAASRRQEVTGLAASGEDIFVAGPSLKDFSYVVYRYDRQLKNPKTIVEKLSGCCGQMDIQARDGKLWIAHNARHRVESHDRDGKLLVSFGKEDRKAADGFGGCCEPKNLRALPDGDVLAAESGPPVAVKRFDAAGKFKGVLAAPAFKSGCVRTTVDQSPDGKRLYLLDTGGSSIHVFAPGT
jgi:hypothetical protein